MLVKARLTVAAIPLERWRRSLGGVDSFHLDVDVAKQVAADIEWAATRVPLRTKCLPRAVALSWMLRKRNIGHAVIFAVRPEAERGAADDLHAWVEAGGEVILGDLPGPWIETLRLDGNMPV